MEPAPRNVRTAWLAWFTWLVIGGALLFEDWKIGGAGFNLILTSPFWLLWLAWPAWRAWTLMRARGWVGPVANWDGRCLEFEGEPLRVIRDDAQNYVVLGDLAELFELAPGEIASGAPRQRLPGFSGEVLAFESVEDWLAAQDSERAQTCLAWLAREVPAAFSRAG